MRGFLTKMSVFVAINGVVFLGLLHWHLKISAQGFYAALNDKQTLLQNTPSPRILLVGGSNVAFGFDSGVISRFTHRPTINLAITSELGRRFILNQAAAHVRPGDIVVLSLEYSLFANQGKAHAHALSGVLEAHPPAIRYFGIREQKSVLDDGLIYLGGVVRSGIDCLQGDSPYQKPELQTPYRRNGFNRLGDMVAHHELNPAPWLVAAELNSPLQIALDDHDLRDAADEISRFVTLCRGAGVAVFLQLPPIPLDSFEKNRAAIFEIHAAVRQIPGLVVLNQPADVPYPKDLFFDTVFHLRQAGAARRTRELTERLQLTP